MTNSTDACALIWANHEIQHNHHSHFETIDRVNPETGEFAVRAQTVILAPDRIHEVPQALADELFALAASQPLPCVRRPDDREVLSFNHAHGRLIDNA